MDKFKKVLGLKNAQINSDAKVGEVKHAQPRGAKVDTQEFAKAVVDKYGETLVLLGKE